jgi:signal peptidase I
MVLKPLVRYSARAVAALAVTAGLGVLLGALGVLAAPRLLGLQPTIVLSGSMEPALRVGGLAFVRSLEAPLVIEGGSTGDPTAAIGKGEIITFRAPRNPEYRVSHRVIGVIDNRDGRRFATRGDANAQPDPVLVPAENVVGTVAYHVPYLGYLVSWLQRPWAFIVLAGLPTAFIVVSESRSVFRDMRAQRHPSRADLHRLLRALARA